MNERLNVEVSGVFKVGENTELIENITPDFLGEEEIAERKSRIEHINTAVQHNKISTGEADAQVSVLEQDIFELEGAETVDNRSEWRQLKEEFRESKRAYLEALEQDYADRNLFKKAFGLGRKKFSEPVQKAYDAFMDSSQIYYSYAQNTGHYERVVERLNHRVAPEEQKSINFLAADRHIFRPAEERLERQKVHLPAYLLNVKKTITEKVKAHPKTAIGIGALLFALNPAAVAAGLGVRYMGNKFYASGKEEKRDSTKNATIENLDSYVGLDEMEAQYFESARQAHDAKVRSNVVAVGAAMTAGGVYGSEVATSFPGSESVPVGGEGAIDTSAVDEAVRLYTENPDVFSVESKPGVGAEDVLPTESSFEAIHTVEKGESLSKIVLESLRERVLAGEVQLPEGVDQDRLAHYIYQSFPEMTNASDIQPRLSAAEWQALGVESGNPQFIRVGEQINVDALIDKMWGANPGGGVNEVQDTLSNGVLGSDELPSELDEAQAVADARVTAEVHEAEMTPSEYPEQVSGGKEELAPEVSQNIGVSDGNLSETPGGTSNEVFDIRPEAESMEGTSDLGKLEVPATAPAPEMSTASSVETASEVPFNNRSAELYEMLRGDFSDPDMVKAAMNELTSGYQPIMSERLAELTTPWQPGKTLHEHLYQTMLESYRAGNMSLPFETMRYVEANETALYGFIEKYLPDVSENTLSKFFRGVGSDVLTAEQWQAYGIGGGNPKMIDPGDQVQTGEIIKLMLERAAQAVNKT